MAEDDKERLNRELIELLNELRVAIPGVQVLFAFLLTVPFAQGFAQVTPTQRKIYFACVLCTAAATGFLMAPTAYHRIQFRERDKEQMIRTSNGLAITGMFFLAAAMSLVVLLITDVIYGGVWTWIATASVAVLIAGLWYALPLSRRARGSSD